MKKMMIVIGLLGLVTLGFVVGRYTTRNQGMDEYELTEVQHVELLSYEVQDLEDSFEGSEDLALFLELHGLLVEKHHILVEKHQTLQASRIAVQEARLAFKELHVRLSVQDGTTLWKNYNELLDIKNTFTATQGQAYQRLVDLKGQYNIENIALIIQTYQEVLAVFNQREILLDQAIQVFNESLIIYQNYTHM